MHLPATVLADQIETPATVVDLSRSGVALASRWLWPFDDVVCVRVGFGPRAVVAPAIVRRVERDTMGLSWIPSSTTTSRISELLQRTDRASRFVLPPGFAREVARHGVLRRLLRSLLERRECSHALLAVEVLRREGYHPARDDARLRIVVTRLRRLLCDTGETERVIVTTALGYRLGRDEESAERLRDMLWPASHS